MGSLQPGQCFMAGFDGQSIPDALCGLLRDGGLAGVVFFQRNIATVEKLRNLIAECHDLAGRPLLIAVDHEGGRVFRMPKPFTPVPAMRTFGDYAHAHPDGERLVFDVGTMMATELRTVGININFAPVLDINTNYLNPIIGDRAFGSDADTVQRLGCALIRGLAEGGVAACGKHFPGHGDTGQDSHVELPKLPHTLDRLRWMELVPFRAAIAAGVPMIMPAHIVYGGVDAANPITFSKRAIVSLLRDELSFDGVVVTDDLEMGAIQSICAPGEAAVRAFMAGCDLALVCRDLAATTQAIDAVAHALDDGTLSESMLTASAHRIRSLAERFPSTPSQDLSPIGASAHKTLMHNFG